MSPARLKAAFWRRGTFSGSSTPVSIQFLSDLHLEAFGLYESFQIPVAGCFLLLGGDIGKLVTYDRLKGFLHRQCGNFERVFLILGNHEFFGTSHDRGVEFARSLEAEAELEGKLTLLYRTRVDLSEDVTLLGCTLHSYIPQDAREEVQRRVADFRHIDEWTVDSHNEQHARDVSWLKEQLDTLSTSEPGRKVIIATHHAPLVVGTSDPVHKGPLNTAFATNVLVDAQSWDGIGAVKTWLFGHTHWCCDFVTGGIRVAANQYGYFSKAPETPKTAWYSFDSRKRKPQVTFDPQKCMIVE